MINVHTRVLSHPITAVRPWIELAWSGTDRDIFPRDYIANWRANPEGTAASALIPGVTRLGHGPFKFKLTKWDGTSWRVALERGSGWHGFELEALGEETRITHTLDAELSLLTRTVILPIHDWAVESMFDRLEAALATGVVPAKTARPMARRARLLYAAMTLSRRVLRARRGPRTGVRSTATGSSTAPVSSAG